MDRRPKFHDDPDNLERLDVSGGRDVGLVLSAA
jgi:hypothetical protein